MLSPRNWIWFESLSTILLSATQDREYELAVYKVNKLKDEQLSYEHPDDQEPIKLKPAPHPNYAKSPFYKKALQIFLNIKKKLSTRFAMVWSTAFKMEN